MLLLSCFVEKTLGKLVRPCTWAKTDNLMRILAANSFLAHLSPLGEGQPLGKYLLRVSAITSRLAAKTGMPLGALIGFAHAHGKYSPRSKSTSRGLRA